MEHIVRGTGMRIAVRKVKRWYLVKSFCIVMTSAHFEILILAVRPFSLMLLWLHHRFFIVLGCSGLTAWCDIESSACSEYNRKHL